jgi:hypothetical protein
VLDYSSGSFTDFILSDQADLAGPGPPPPEPVGAGPAEVAEPTAPGSTGPAVPGPQEPVPDMPVPDMPVPDMPVPEMRVLDGLVPAGPAPDRPASVVSSSGDASLTTGNTGTGSGPGTQQRTCRTGQLPRGDQRGRWNYR